MHRGGRLRSSAAIQVTVTVTVIKPPKRQPTPNAVGPALGLRQTTGVGLMSRRPAQSAPKTHHGYWCTRNKAQAVHLDGSRLKSRTPSLPTGAATATHSGLPPRKPAVRREPIPPTHRVDHSCSTVQAQEPQPPPFAARPADHRRPPTFPAPTHAPVPACPRRTCTAMPAATGCLQPASRLRCSVTARRAPRPP